MLPRPRRFGQGGRRSRSLSRAHGHTEAETRTYTITLSRSHVDDAHDAPMLLTRRRHSSRSNHTADALAALARSRSRSHSHALLSCSHSHAHHTHPEAAETHALRGWRRQQNKTILSSRGADVGRRGRRGRGSRGRRASPPTDRSSSTINPDKGRVLRNPSSLARRSKQGERQLI